MGRSKASMFGTPLEDAGYVKKPTLKQFLKEIPAGYLQRVFPVLVIWLPRRWRNYTLETEAFRANVKEGTSLYAAFDSQLDAFTRGTSGIQIDLHDELDGSFVLNEAPNAGEWFFIGDMGLKFEPNHEE